MTDLGETAPPQPIGEPLRVPTGRIDLQALPAIGGVQLVYRPDRDRSPTAILLTPRQAAALAARLLEWAQ